MRICVDVTVIIFLSGEVENDGHTKYSLISLRGHMKYMKPTFDSFQTTLN